MHSSQTPHMQSFTNRQLTSTWMLQPSCAQACTWQQARTLCGWNVPCAYCAARCRGMCRHLQQETRPTAHASMYSMSTQGLSDSSDSMQHAAPSDPGQNVQLPHFPCNNTTNTESLGGSLGANTHVGSVKYCNCIQVQWATRSPLHAVSRGTSCLRRYHYWSMHAKLGLHWAGKLCP